MERTETGTHQTDEQAFSELVAKLRAGQLEPPPSTEAMEPLQPGDVEPWPDRSSERGRAFIRLGEEAFRQGQVASLVVAGGAGTRFGGAVKALVPVHGERTFLDFKLADARRAAAGAGRPVPVAIMTSPLTHQGITDRVRGEPDVHVFQQRMLPRLTPELEVFRDASGQPSLAPAGHGDVLRALRESGVGEALRRRGVRLLYFANVDNLAASLDPLVIGAHLALGRDMTVEVTPRRRQDGGLDTGAAPVRVKGRVQLVEHVQAEQHPLISTNDITFELSRLLDRELHLPWRVARKQVEGRAALQLEQVTGEVTGVLDTAGQPVMTSAYLEVPRHDLATTRFEPVKAREDLPRTEALLQARHAI